MPGAVATTGSIPRPSAGPEENTANRTGQTNGSYGNLTATAALFQANQDQRTVKAPAGRGAPVVDHRRR